MAGRVLVTGGGRGIGAGIVRALAEAGHGVDFTYNASKEEAEALAASLPGEGRALPCDLSERAAVDAFAEHLPAGPLRQPRHTARGLLSACVGAMTVARAVHDRELAEDFLAAGIALIEARLDTLFAEAEMSAEQELSTD